MNSCSPKPPEHSHLKPQAGQVISHTLSSQPIHHLYLDLALALGQQLIPYPILVSKVASAALVWVVLAQHALQPVATMMPAPVVQSFSDAHTAH